MIGLEIRINDEDPITVASDNLVLMIVDAISKEILRSDYGNGK